MARDRNRFEGYDFRPRNEEERLFCRSFDAIFDTDDGIRGFSRTAVPVKEAVRQFFDRVEAKGDEGYRLAGQLLREELENRCASRTLFSQVLTCMARRFVDEQSPRTYVDAQGKVRPMFMESRVHHAGRVLASMLRRPDSRQPEDDRVVPALIAWCEDMETGIVEGGVTVLERQETSIIRGALFASSVDHRIASSFWDAAFAAKRFPWRIFSDPCRSERGVIYSPQQARVMGMIVGLASEPAVRRIAGQMVEHATHRRDEVRSKDLLPYDATVPATPAERQAGFDAVVANIADPGRRALVRELLRPAFQR